VMMTRPSLRARSMACGGAGDECYSFSRRNGVTVFHGGMVLQFFTAARVNLARTCTKRSRPSQENFANNPDLNQNTPKRPVDASVIAWPSL